MDGWYIGAAPMHYRCHKTYIKKTGAERIAKTGEFFPHNTKIPKYTKTDAALKAAEELIDVLQTPTPVKSVDIIPKQAAALKELASIFRNAFSRQEQRVESVDKKLPQSQQRVREKETKIFQTAPQKQPSNRPRPNIVKPEEDDPVISRYSLRTREVQANHVQTAIKGMIKDM